MQLRVRWEGQSFSSCPIPYCIKDSNYMDFNLKQPDGHIQGIQL